MTEYPVIPGGTPKWIRDATLNDSDKTFTVPTGKSWLLSRIAVEIVCTATVGNRNLSVRIADSAGGYVYVYTTTTAITASQSGVIYVGDGATSNMGPKLLSTGGTPNLAGYESNFAPMWLTAGMTIRVYDIGAVDAAADDMIVVLHYIEYEA